VGARVHGGGEGELEFADVVGVEGEAGAANLIRFDGEGFSGASLLSVYQSAGSSVRVTRPGLPE